MTHRAFAPKALARGAARRRRRAPRGTAFTYRLTENSPVSISVARRTGGRRVGRGCRKATRRLRHRKRCTRYVRRGAIRVATARSGANKTSFSGRFGRRALRRGRYRATLVATDSTGRKSNPLRVGFKIVRR
jgi:hypothetical protein